MKLLQKHIEYADKNPHMSSPYLSYRADDRCPTGLPFTNMGTGPEHLFLKPMDFTSGQRT